MAGFFTGSKCSCPSKSDILFIILTLTAAGIHGVSQLSYMTSYDKSCELHTEDVKCHIHQGLWYYCETALGNSTTSCSYGKWKQNFFQHNDNFIKPQCNKNMTDKTNIYWNSRLL